MTDTEGTGRQAADISPTAGSSDSSHTRERFVNLGDAFPKTSMWSNDPKDMQLDTYFNNDPNVPRLGDEYNMAFRPIIVLPNSSAGNTYLLTDDIGGFFLWNETDGEMWRFKGEKLKMHEVVEKVRKGAYDGTQLVRQFYNPSGRKNQGG